ncbi:ORF6N domain-containing protein [Salmonella enterica]|uniref:ORF6N domain-containing protein n=5 Tax=Salmonella enterica TaxID=28901 RepID=A0A5W6KTM0_SALTM|nr:ORF6N domain-containing protein [Salmonella enterica subsp. enterica serovar Typhimurium]EAM7684662.1 ORF6N domain-containing protein [Salmonella enterica]EBG0649570.1 ORF6N domain-containing protein [Salmonella enterica subsp. enterica serovar Perth]EBX5472329.1 ORF6N domain-containing protein [Salmonella enterica subsp. enterica serovar Gaminara]ECU9013912.1 ORF6N domain-containing protein [Salmonella enterica subsp. enterica serovar Enteritidis]EDP9707209.1 ORF6N domain-containing protei
MEICPPTFDGFERPVALSKGANQNIRKDMPMNSTSVENLPSLTHNHLPVITTELLAELYGTERQRLTNNFNRNKERFIEGKHFFLIEGDELRELKNRNSLRVSVKIARNVRSLILWTERGAARHAKMLETDQAWEVFEKLEDCYFSQKNPSVLVSCQKSYDTRVLCYQQSGVTVSTILLRDDDIVISLESWLELARANGWFVIRKDQLVERLMQL